MANLPVLDGNGDEKFLKQTGAGTLSDPHIPHHHVDTLPADPLGTNADAVVAAGAEGSLSAKARRVTADLGTALTSLASLLTAVDGVEALLSAVGTLLNGGLPAALGGAGGLKVEQVGAIPAGTANIGDVDVATLPALPAGNNNIGDVDVASLPALPAGTNNIGDVDVLSLPALPAGTNNIGDVDVLTQKGAGNLANGQATVDTTAGGVEVVAARATRRAVTVVNLGTTDVYVGQGSVTTANGALLVGVKGAAITLTTTAQVKAIVGAGSQGVSYLEEYD